MRRYLTERISALDGKNRKALEVREYHMNCGRLQELERLMAELDEVINSKFRDLEDDDDE